MKPPALSRLIVLATLCLSPVLVFGNEPDGSPTVNPLVTTDDLASLGKLFTLSLNAPSENGSGGYMMYQEFAFSIGYSKVQLVNAGGPFNDEDTLRMEPRYSFNPIAAIPALRLGLSLGMDFGGSGLSSGAIIVNDGQVIIIGSGREQSLTIFEPEVQLSLRLGNGQFYVEPGISGGGAFGYYRVGEHYYYYSDTIYDSWGSTAYGRAFVRVGFAIPGGYFGVDASYLRGGNMSFSDNISGDLEEFYIGVFGALVF